MAINGIKPVSQGVGEASSANLSEPAVSEVEKVSVQTADAATGQNAQVGSITTDNQQTTDEQLDKKLKDAINMANNKMKQSNPQTRCEFTYHEDMNRVSIKLVNKETDEVVKEIPPEKTIKMIEKLWEVAGLLVDEKL